MTPLRSKLVRTSLVTLGTVGLAVVLVVVILQLRISQRNLATNWSQIERALESKGRLLVGNQAVAMRAFVADNAFADLRQLIERTIADEDDVVFGAFVDRGGHTWAYGDRTMPTADPNRNGAGEPYHLRSPERRVGGSNSLARSSLSSRPPSLSMARTPASSAMASRWQPCAERTSRHAATHDSSCWKPSP
jgi:hypothetical protein